MSLYKKFNFIKDFFFNRKIENYYNTDYEKNVLISYITRPFIEGLNFSHSNRIESFKIAETFNELGYNVDIINHDTTKKVDFSQYNIIFGIGNLFENSLVKKDVNKIYIYYATGSYFAFQNAAEMSRIVNLYNRKGILFKPVRLIEKTKYLATQLSDAIIITGNDHTISSYRNSKMPILKVPVSVVNIGSNYLKKDDLDKSKTNFIWLGGNGLIHKGLDICLEVFKDSPNLTLHVFGPEEKMFMEVYKKELLLPNIKFYGYIDVTSSKFIQLSKKCLFTIYPSCSEGQSGALLTCMGMGLIPLSTKESGVDLKNLGFYINENISEIKKIINNVLCIENSVLKKYSTENYNYIKKEHNIDKFKKTFKNNINLILLNKNGRDN